MLKKLAVCFLIGICSIELCKAQDSEFGLMIGGNYYIGDLNPENHFYNTKVAGTMFLRHNFNPRVSLRANIMMGSVEAEDRDSQLKLQQERGLSFQSNLLEFGGLLEINFYPYRIGDFDTPFTPFVFFGFSVFNFNPKAEYNGNLIELQPLGTEGQETSFSDAKKYKLTQLSMPFGAGFKVNLTSKLGLNLEYGFRKTFTDYLDDVSTVYADPNVLRNESSSIAAIMADRSQNKTNEVGTMRGNSPASDWYTFVGVGFTLRVGGKRSTCPSWN